MFLTSFIGFSLLVLSARSAPIETEAGNERLESIQKIENDIYKALSSRQLKDAFRLEQLMENEVLSLALADMFADGVDVKREVKLIEEMAAIDKRVVDAITKELNETDVLRREKRSIWSGGSSSSGAVDSVSGGLGFITSLLGSIKGTGNARRRRQLENEISGEVPEDLELTTETTTESEDDSGGGGGSNLLGAVTNIASNLSGAGAGEVVRNLPRLSGPLAAASSGRDEGTEPPAIISEDGEVEGQLLDLGALLDIVGPLIGTASGGGGQYGNGSGLAETLSAIAGPISGLSVGEDGQSDVAGIVSALAGPLSASSSGGGEDGGGSDVGSFVAGLAAPLSASLSGAGEDGPGGFNIPGTLAGLISGLSSGSSGIGDDGSGGGGSDSGSFLTSLLGGSSGGDGGSDTVGGTGFNPLSLIVSLLSSSSANGDGEGSDGGGGGLNLIASLVSSLSAGGGDGDSSDGGGSGSFLSSLLSSSSSGGTSDSSEGGGSGDFLSAILGASSGGNGYSSGGGDIKGQLLSTLLQVKFSLFQSILSFVTGFLSSGSSGKY